MAGSPQRGYMYPAVTGANSGGPHQMRTVRVKMDFEKEISQKENDAGQITCWCLTIGLHQEFGVGAVRLDRVSAEMIRLEDIHETVMAMYGPSKAREIRTGWLQGKVSEEFRVPLIRAPRGRREQQIRMAMDRMASAAWQFYAASCIRVLGFGSDRLERLRQVGRNNYDQFNRESHEVGEDVAIEHLRRCAEDALKEDLCVIEDDQEGWNEYQKEFEVKRSDALRIQLSECLSRKDISLEGKDIGKIFDQCMKETLSKSGIKRI